jgi:hypothetical protein
MQAAEDLEEDRRNLVCVIQPADYDLEGIVRVLRGLTEQDTQSYVVEALWKYLLISEIALAALREIKELPAPLEPGHPAWELDRYVREAGDVMHRDFTIRLERAVAAVQDAAGGGEIGPERRRISEALHVALIGKLLSLLVPVLNSRRRVAVLIDNLDKAWDTNADVGVLAQLLLGLLTTAQRVGEDIAKRVSGDLWVSLGVFIRSDIFFHVVSEAREPDKIPAKFLTWNDPHLLLQVIEERYLAGRGHKGSGDQLWKLYFDPKTRGVRTPDYISARVLPRPRDILYLTNAALEIAVRHRHTKVTEADVLDAERQYSEFAFSVLLVEGGSDIPNLEDVLFEFAGGEDMMMLPEVHEAVRRAGTPDGLDGVIEELVALSFLGRETRDDVFEYAENPRDLKRINAVARRFAATEGREPRFRVHPAFQAYLDITTDSKQLRLAS